MVRHIVLWNLKDSLTPQEKEEAAQRIQRELHALQGVIEGLVSIQVITNPIQCDRDLVLNSLFVSAEALQHYQSHPAHLQAAQFVRANTQDRICADFTE